MVPNKSESAHELTSTVIRRVNNRDIRQWQYRKNGGNDSAEKVNPEHHLLARNLMTSEYFVLGGVDSPVESEVNEEVCDAYKIRVWGLL